MEEIAYSLFFYSIIVIAYFVLINYRKNKHLKELVILKRRVAYSKATCIQKRDFINFLNESIDTIVSCHVTDECYVYEDIQSELLNNYTACLHVLMSTDKNLYSNLKELEVLEDILWFQLNTKF